MEAVSPQPGARVATLLDDGEILGGLIRARGAAVLVWDGVGRAPECDVVVSLLALGLTDTPRVLDAIGEAIGVTGVAAHVMFSPSSPPLVEGVVDRVLREHGHNSRWLRSLMSELALGAALDRDHAVTTLRDVGRFDSAAQLWHALAEEGALAAELACLPGDLVDAVREQAMVALAPCTRADGTLLVPITARLLVAPTGIV